MKKLTICLLVSAFLVGCNLPLGNPGKVAFNHPPQAWFDAPLDYSRIPLASYPVVFHGSDVDGVTQGELSVNGQVTASLPPEAEAGDHLVIFRVDWTPPEPGEYTLQARALNGSGAWSEYAVAHVVVGETTPTPTSTPTVTPTPVKGQGLTFSNSTSPNQVYYGSCTPNQVNFQVKVNSPTAVYSVVVFVHLQDTSSSAHTAWDAGTAMNGQGSGSFSRTVNTSAINGANQYSSATLLYQFVATAKDGTILGRSPAYNDVVLAKCGVIRIPVPRSYTPTPTEEVVK